MRAHRVSTPARPGGRAAGGAVSLRRTALAAWVVATGVAAAGVVVTAELSRLRLRLPGSPE